MSGRFPTTDETVAYSVTQRLVDFVHRFESRTTDSGALERILEGERFRGGIVGQSPEFFTEQYLIVPVLNALGFEQTRWRPVDLTKAERKEPDLQIDDPPSEIVCIVEAKRLGREREDYRAKEQVKEYLVDNTFVKYATDRDRQYLVGIGTDGLDWSLYAKPIGQREPIWIDTVSIREELLTLTQSVRDANVSSPELVCIRKDIATSLVPLIASHTLRDLVVDEVTHRY